MLEFSSISVSSYDAASLADRLTEKSADGWDVVAIVPAGTNVTAYLSRSTDASAAAVPGSAAASGTPAVGGSSSDDTSGRVPEAVAAERALADAGVASPDTAPVTEPAGWASEPEQTHADAPSAADTNAVDHSGDSATGAVTTAAAGVDVAPAHTPASAPASTPAETVANDAAWADTSTANSTDTSTSATSTSTDTGQQAAAEQQATASSAPAGWYADPAQRYELRYWDGTQWTEHVSRAGQQYTDPPVA